jgi:exo-beta-1,3-glucanase (GH17 family)
MSLAIGIEATPGDETLRELSQLKTALRRHGASSVDAVVVGDSSLEGSLVPPDTLVRYIELAKALINELFNSANDGNDIAVITLENDASLAANPQLGDYVNTTLRDTLESFIHL